MTHSKESKALTRGELIANKRVVYDVKGLAAEIDKAIAEETARLREALEFYANKDNYANQLMGSLDGVPVFADPVILHDGGKIAKQALADDK